MAEASAARLSVDPVESAELLELLPSFWTSGGRRWGDLLAAFLDDFLERVKEQQLDILDGPDRGGRIRPGHDGQREPGAAAGGVQHAVGSTLEELRGTTMWLPDDLVCWLLVEVQEDEDAPPSLLSPGNVRRARADYRRASRRPRRSAWHPVHNSCHTFTMASAATPSEADILSRILDPGKATLPSQTAEMILALDFPSKDRARIDELAEKARSGTLTAEEQVELDAYERVGHFLSLLKSKARTSLKQGGALPADAVSPSDGSGRRSIPVSGPPPE